MEWLHNFITPLICVWVWGLLLLAGIYGQGVTKSCQNTTPFNDQRYIEHLRQFTFYVAFLWAVEVCGGIGIALLIFENVRRN